jgi:hypothetical protein
MNYPWINKALTIIKGINLFYIFILKNIFKFKNQSWFDKFLDSNEISMNFGEVWTIVTNSN